MPKSKRPTGKKKSIGKFEVEAWLVLINSSSESTMFEELPSSLLPSVENLYSLTVEPAELCAVLQMRFSQKRTKMRAQIHTKFF